MNIGMYGQLAMPLIVARQHLEGDSPHTQVRARRVIDQWSRLPLLHPDHMTIITDEARAIIGMGFTMKGWLWHVLNPLYRKSKTMSGGASMILQSEEQRDPGLSCLIRHRFEETLHEPLSELDNSLTRLEDREKKAATIKAVLMPWVGVPFDEERARYDRTQDHYDEATCLVRAHDCYCIALRYTPGNIGVMHNLEQTKRRLGDLDELTKYKDSLNKEIFAISESIKASGPAHDLEDLNNSVKLRAKIGQMWTSLSESEQSVCLRLSTLLQKQLQPPRYPTVVHIAEVVLRLLEDPNSERSTIIEWKKQIEQIWAESERS